MCGVRFHRRFVAIGHALVMFLRGAVAFVRERAMMLHQLLRGLAQIDRVSCAVRAVGYQMFLQVFHVFHLSSFRTNLFARDREPRAYTSTPTKAFSRKKATRCMSSAFAAFSSRPPSSADS